MWFFFFENWSKRKWYHSTMKVFNNEKTWQADVEVTFSFASLDKAESFDPKWNDMYAQDVCGLKGADVQGGLGPFGLATLATENLEENTPVFFRVFKAQQNYKVLLCSDAKRYYLLNF